MTMFQYSVAAYENDGYNNKLLKTFETPQDLIDKWFHKRWGRSSVTVRDKRDNKLRYAWHGIQLQGKGLELAFGFGTSVYCLLNNHPEIETLDCIDFCPTLQKIGDFLKEIFRERIGEIKIASTADMSFWADNSYAFINSSSVFEHLPNDVYWDTVHECFRVLEPGGLMGVYVDQSIEPQHIRIKPPRVTAKELKEVGFEVVNNYLFRKPK